MASVQDSMRALNCARSGIEGVHLVTKNLSTEDMSAGDDDVLSKMKASASTHLFVDLGSGALETNGSASASDILPQVSLWDLRSDIKMCLQTSSEDDEVVAVPRHALLRMLEVMREHVAHRQLERSLRKESKAHQHRADSLQREAFRLRRSISLQPARRDSSNGLCTSPQGTRSMAGALHADSGTGTAAHWSATGLLPFASGAPEAGLDAAVATGASAHIPTTKPLAALTSGESMDAKSLKSDILTGEELEALRGAAGGQTSATASASASPSRDLRNALQALAEERRKNQEASVRIEELERRLAFTEEAPALAGDAAALGANSASVGGGEVTPRPSGSGPGDYAAPPSSSSLRRGTPPGERVSGAWSFVMGQVRGMTAGGSASTGGNGGEACAPRDAGAGGASGAEFDALMGDLTASKVKLAETEGALTAARRDVARVRDELRGAQGEVVELREERDRAMEEVGSLMVQLHVLEGEKEALKLTLRALGAPSAPTPRALVGPGSVTGSSGALGVPAGSRRVSHSGPGGAEAIIGGAAGMGGGPGGSAAAGSIRAAPSDLDDDAPDSGPAAAGTPEPSPRGARGSGRVGSGSQVHGSGNAGLLE